LVSCIGACFIDYLLQQIVIGTKVGRAKHMRIMPGGALETEQSLSGPSSIFVGKKLDEHRGSFILEHPMDKGHVVDGGWDAMESLWEVWSSDIV
jgi:centractin